MDYVFPRLQMPDFPPEPNKRNMQKANQNKESSFVQKQYNRVKSAEENITTKTKRSQIVRLDPPVATTKLAYITFIINKYIRLTYIRHNSKSNRDREREGYNFREIMWRGNDFEPIATRNYIFICLS